MTGATGAPAASAALLAKAHAWIDDDPDAETRAELQALVAEAAHSADAATELQSRFDGRLAFGTAGLRGELAAGPMRMNRVVVAQAAAGLAAYLLEHASGDARPSVVIGYDGRKNSAVFARDTAELMSGAGVRAILLPRLLPTPVLAFAVRHLDADAGVMVTASHNPARDNGYKVYLGGADQGSQIVAPADASIAAHIERIAAGPVGGLPRSDAFELAEESLVDAYVSATASVAGTPVTAGPTTSAASGTRVDTAPLRVVYTAMHGVGWETASAVFAAARLPAPVSVAEQQEPDPDFPTVSFPNPEEPGALDLAFALARESGADLVVANDPDADRLALGIPDPAAEAGYRRLSGNELGTLLGWDAAERRAAAGAAATPSDAAPSDAGEHPTSARGALAASIVSSPALGAVAAAYHLDFVETLTGFKWVSRVPHLIFGYEEALGYLVNAESVRDKDGISAATAALALAVRLRAGGRTIGDRLDDFAARFGAYASDQISVRVTDLARIAAIMTALRRDPPDALGTVPVERIDDLSAGSAALPPSDVLRIVLADGSRVMVRPSGTEPKLKIYVDAFDDATPDVAQRRAAAERRVAALGGAMRALTDAV